MTNPNFESIVEVEEVFSNFNLSTPEGVQNAITTLSKKSWDELITLLKRVKFKEKEELVKEIEKETQKTEAQIRYIKQLLIEYGEEKEFRKIKDTELYKKLMEFLDYLENKYIKLVEKMTAKEKEENMRVLIIIKAMLRKNEGKEAKKEISKFKKD